MAVSYGDEGETNRKKPKTRKRLTRVLAHPPPPSHHPSLFATIMRPRDSQNVIIDKKKINITAEYAS